MENISIRSLQHYLYCPHRWGLIEIGRCWSENYYVVRANLMHDRVHIPNRYKSRAKTVYTSVHIWNDEYGLYGVADCIEETEKGLCVVEYKPHKPKGSEFNREDAIQVYAQKVCTESVFGRECNCVIYYADEKKRVELPFDTEKEEYESLLRGIICEIKDNTVRGIIPPIKDGQYCNGCSMYDLCMPKGKLHNLKAQIYRQIEEDV